MSFDDIIDRIGTNCAKWDKLEALYGIPADDALAMWVADMDFRSPDCVVAAAQRLTDVGVFGYRADYSDYHGAIRWWMQTRHGWEVEADQIFSTYGLVNGLAMCLHAYTRPGDEVVIFTPVYHVFAKAIREAGRVPVERHLVVDADGLHRFDFDAYDAQMTGREKMLVLCSPNNPGGRVWTAEELRAVAEFAARHDLLIVSDEIHHDLIYPGQKHIPLPLAAPDHMDRIIMMTAPSKTFNIAGNHDGNVIVQDADLRKPFADLMTSLHVSPTLFGTAMTQAAYSAEGAAWLDDLNPYLAGNADLFTTALNGLPGVSAMPMQGTYLAWIDFNGTGMTQDQINDRVVKEARIAPSYGPTFGSNGDGKLRFNLGMPRARVIEATERLAAAFSDLQ